MFACLIAMTPAGATIEKIMNQCNGKLCPFFRASIVIPDGWGEDKDSTRYFNSQFLLPKGTDSVEPSRGDGKVSFVRRQFEAASLHDQGYELQAVTTDGDNDGNEFLVT